jgi:hypothetical protein
MIKRNRFKSLILWLLIVHFIILLAMLFVCHNHSRSNNAEKVLPVKEFPTFTDYYTVLDSLFSRTNLQSTYLVNLNLNGRLLKSDYYNHSCIIQRLNRAGIVEDIFSITENHVPGTISSFYSFSKLCRAYDDNFYLYFDPVEDKDSHFLDASKAFYIIWESHYHLRREPITITEREFRIGAKIDTIETNLSEKRIKEFFPDFTGEIIRNPDRTFYFSPKYSPSDIRFYDYILNGKLSK